MTEKTKHPLANVLGWIAEGSVVEYRAPQGSIWVTLNTGVPFSLFHDFEYRKKTVPKYRVLYKNATYVPSSEKHFLVSTFYYYSLEDFVISTNNDRYTPIQLIEESRIET